MPVMLLAVSLSLAAPAHAAPQDPGSVQIQASQQLFTMVGAMFAAGYDHDPNAPTNDPLVERFRALQGPSVDALRSYFQSHQAGDATFDVSRYVTFALISGEPPRFDPKLRREDLPPDVLSLEGFRDVLVNFYQDAQIAALWREFQPRYAQSEEQLREPLSRAVLTTMGYLREVAKSGRTFNVYVEPLIGGQIHVRNIGDEYALVINPAISSFDEMRHAYLHFMLDPVVIRYRDQLLPADVLFRIALRAPRLQEGLRKDSLAFFAECLVRAVELRMRKLPAAQQNAEIERAEGDGLLLVRSLFTALQSFEKAEPALSFYFPDMLKSMDLTSERVRLQAMRFPESEQPLAVASPEVSEKDRAIETGDRLTAAGNVSAAAEAYSQALAMAPNDPRALFGTAVVSLMRGDGERAFEIFSRVAAAASEGDAAARPDSSTLAWAHVYLGRLHDLAGERDQAVAEYRAALAVEGAPVPARAAAQKGVDQAYQPATRNQPPG